jgi:Restriction endonuclease
MVNESALSGYLLEETLAWLLASSGYRLLVEPDHDERELIAGRHGLLVKGRGADHQVDALGELIYTAPFSLPLRLFVEAKFRNSRTGLETVRNAYGVLRDVNENYLRTSTNDRPHRRYQYAYALFSTSGFSRNAQEFALAHQISLVDLSSADFEDLREAIQAATREVLALVGSDQGSPFPVGQFRRLCRIALGTQGEYEPAAATAENAWLSERLVVDIAARLKVRLQEYTGGEFILAFPPAPFVLVLRGSRRAAIDRFLTYCARAPQHTVGLRHRPGSNPRSSTWEVFPRDETRGYLLTFTLPDRVEDWIARNGRERQAARTVKEDLLPSLLIYRFTDGHPQVIRLTYGPAALQRA